MRTRLIPVEHKGQLKEEFEKPVRLRVFVSLTCPYCPLVTSLAHQFALESDFVRADIVDVGELLHLEQRYNVVGVPKTITNKKTESMGTVLEELFVQAVVVVQRLPTMYV